MKTLGYIGAFLGGAIAAPQWDCYLPPKRVKTHVRRLQTLLTIFSKNTISS